LRRALAALVPLILAGPANAHAFTAGADSYAQFVEGASVILIYPAILLPILALGLLLSLWHDEGLPKAWPVFLGGQVLGVFAATAVGPGALVLFIALGVVTSAIAALISPVPRWAAYGLAGLVGMGALAMALEGHGLFELPIFTHLGLLFGANLAVALGAGVSRLILVWVEAAWVRIGVRVAASWIGAILILTLAFEMSGAVN
jgi:hypothetical protein